jgi:ATP-dependent DNA ligase
VFNGYLVSQVADCDAWYLSGNSELRNWTRPKPSRKRTGSVNDIAYEGDGEIVFEHVCKLGCEGIVSKRLGSLYRSGRSPHWVKVKNPKAPAVTREADEDWGR